MSYFFYIYILKKKDILYILNFYVMDFFSRILVKFAVYVRLDGDEEVLVIDQL